MLAEVTTVSIAAALRRFVDHRVEAGEAAERLRELVVQDYDVDRNAANLLDCYRRAEEGARELGAAGEPAR
jgi:hypothetical protein